MRVNLTKVDGLTIKMKSSNDTDLDKNTHVECLASQIRKLIHVGTHVKDVDVRHADDTYALVTVDSETTNNSPGFKAVALAEMPHNGCSCTLKYRHGTEMPCDNDVPRNVLSARASCLLDCKKGNSII